MNTFVLVRLLFELTMYSDEINRIDPNFMDNAVSIMNHIQLNEQNEITSFSRGGEQDRQEQVPN